MPKTSSKYPFESIIVQHVACRVAKLRDLNEGSSFILIPNKSGAFELETFEPTADAEVSKRLRALDLSDQSYLCCNPLEDGMEYVGWNWQKISKQEMEKLMQYEFSASDFTNVQGTEIDYPESWGVTF